MNNKNASQLAPYRHENHRRPLSRRDLLANGFISYGAYLAAPSVLSLVAGQAQAQAQELQCSSGAAGGGMTPFIVLDLAGGANIAGTNVIVGDKGGQSQLLPQGSYATLGLASEQDPNTVGVDSELGLAFHPASKMLEGIKAVSNATTRANVDGALFCTASGDDTRGNPHNPLYWIAKAGLGGELVSLLGTADGPSGGRAAAPRASINPSLQPSRITRPEDALGLVDKGKLANLLSGADVTKIMKATQKMSEAKLARFQQKDLTQQVRELIQCGYINSADFLSKFDTERVDPRQDTQITTAFPNVATDNLERRAGSIAKMVLDGFAGAGVIEMGGYDYHGQGRATQDRRDLAAGQMIGKLLEAAALKQKNLMIYVYTDGGVSARAAGAVNGIFPFTSDSGQRSSAFLLTYRAGSDGRPPMRSEARQVGGFKAGGSVDTAANQISGSVENLTKAVVANYLALHGMEGKFAEVVGDDPFGAKLEEYLAFAKLV